MVFFNSFLERCVYLIARESQRGGNPVNRTKLTKLLYLADLRAVDAGIELRTGVAWHWDHYGPFDAAVICCEEQMVARGVLNYSTEFSPSGMEYTTVVVPELVNLNPLEDVDEGSARFLELVADVTSEFCSWSAAEVREYSYTTAPMLLAQSDEGRRHCMLDISLGEHVKPKNSQDRLSRVRALRARYKGEFSQGHEGDPDELLSEVHALDGVRREANLKILGGESRQTA